MELFPYFCLICATFEKFSIRVQLNRGKFLEMEMIYLNISSFLRYWFLHWKEPEGVVITSQYCVCLLRWFHISIVNFIPALIEQLWRFRRFAGFHTCWPQMTFWSAQNTLKFLYMPQWIFIVHMKFTQPSLNHCADTWSYFDLYRIAGFWYLIWIPTPTVK